MAETADQIRAGIEQTRADLDVKLHRIESKARRELSLRSHVARHPWQALGIAGGTGLLLGLVFGGGKRKGDESTPMSDEPLGEGP